MNEKKDDLVEEKDASSLKLHRRVALKRIAALGGVSSAILVAAKCVTPAYTVYCNGCGRNYHHYGDNYCNYYDYYDGC